MPFSSFRMRVRVRATYACALFNKESEDVVDVGVQHQCYEEDEAYPLGLLHDVLRDFLAGDDFPKQEEHVTAVEAGDGDDVHEGEDDAEEGSHHPEAVPVPYGGEDAADGAESAERLGALLGEDVLEVADVALQRVPAVAYAGGDGGPEAVLLRLPLIGGFGGVDAHLEVAAGGDGDGVGAAGTVVDEGEVVVHDVAFSFAGGESGKGALELHPGVGLLAVDADDAVASLKPGGCGTALGQHLADDHGRVVVDEGGGEVEEADVLGHVEGDLLAVAQHGHGLGGGDGAQHVGIVARERHLVGAQQLVVVAEAHGLGIVTELHAVAAALQGTELVAPDIEHGGIEQERHDEVVDHAAHHDEQPLPGFLGAELPGLRLRGKVGKGLRLVDHAGYGAVSAEGYPADAELGVVGVAAPVAHGERGTLSIGHGAVEGVALLVLLGLARGIVGQGHNGLLHVGGEEADAHATIYFLHAHQRELGVEEHVELRDAGLEELRPQEVAELVEDDEDGEGEKELGCVHLLVHPASGTFECADGMADAFRVQSVAEGDGGGGDTVLNIQPSEGAHSNASHCPERRYQVVCEMSHLIHHKILGVEIC